MVEGEEQAEGVGQNRMQEPTVKEYYDLKQLFAYPEWRRYEALLKSQEEYFQKEANNCVRNNDILGAVKFIAQKDLIPKLLGKIKDRAKSKKPKE